ncbi:hypothetical protein [Anaerotalea alkaliphila]|nr:hypothetical protein [Anaerotalea alkaliphila]
MGNGLGDDLRKLMLAGIGGAAVAAESAKKGFDILVEKGDATVRKGKAAYAELKHKASPSSLIDRVDQLTPEELQALKARIGELERQGKE